MKWAIILGVLVGSIIGVLRADATNLVFSETMASTNGVIAPWIGGGCDNAWTVTGNAFAQGTNWNYGTGNPCGLQFKEGTANLNDNMLTLAQGISVTGSAAYVEFYLKTGGLTTNTGWTLQLDAGAGYVTRLSELNGVEHTFQLYHYDLQPSELVSNLHLRFQFAGGAPTNRINLDQISLYVVPATNSGFTGSIVLGRPTANSIAINALSDTNLVAYFEYGTQPGVYPSQSTVTNLAAGQPQEVVLDSLQANTRFYYRLRFHAMGETTFLAGAEHTFMTQRARGSTFTFDVEADPHYNDAPGTVPSIWQQTLTNVLADTPDFLIDLGDTFMGEKYSTTNNGYSMTQPGIADACAAVRSQFFSIVGHSVPLFLVEGNHDPELGWWLSNDAPHDNPPVWAASARDLYYPCPIPGSFYSGATATDFYQQQPRDGYYAFEWGDALFVVLDPFWYSNQAVTKSKDPWAWTLGTNQYYWLKSTLENSTAYFKFIFIHHLVGGSFDSTARGGVEFAPYFEWGGNNTNGTWGFTANRPGWPLPIHNLLVSNNVTAMFHGHDHLYVRQSLDGIIYQEVPQPSHYPYDSTNSATNSNYNYLSGILYGSSGHLRVTVSSTNAVVDYVRSSRPSDIGPGITNQMVTYSYTIPSPVTVDTVGDGIADSWRRQYFGGTGKTTNNFSCATCDADGTGQNNFFKFTAGLDPTNSASRLAIIHVATASNDVALSWIGGVSAWQYLESADSLTNWAAIFTNVPPTPVTNSIFHTGAAAEPQLFYRVKARRTP
jgi:hypothetical protein